MIAAEHKYYEILKILLTKSQDTNLDFNIRCPDGKTAFIYACISNENEGQAQEECQLAALKLDYALIEWQTV